MLSYLIGIAAILLFFSNPITQFFYPNRQHGSLRHHAPKPKLNESLLAVDGPNATDPICPTDTYVARILRREPLVVYLENFLSEDERSHLMEISDPIYEPALIGSRDQELDASIRDSHVAVIPRTDSVRCIERRALGLQGWRRDVWIERLRTQRYDAPTGHYSHHYDWNVHRGGWGRVSSFMVWVDDGEGGVEGGGTEFPYLEPRWGDDEEGKREWCRFIECEEDDGDGDGDGEEGSNDEGGMGEHGSRNPGTTFKVKPGNAVYWENFAPDGHGYEETWHAGLPVKKGTKVGLNIWTFGRIE